MSATKTRGRGRPALPDDERATSVTVRIGPDDKENLDSIKQEYECTTSDAFKLGLAELATKIRRKKQKA